MNEVINPITSYKSKLLFTIVKLEFTNFVLSLFSEDLVLKLPREELFRLSLCQRWLATAL